MTLSNRKFQLVFLLTLVALLVALALPVASFATPAYATATGQSCGTCHVSAAGGGARTAVGQRFEAMATHSTNPAAAWAQMNQTAATPAATAAATAVATAAATPRPAATTAPAAATTTAATVVATAAPTTLPKTGDPGTLLAASGAALLLAVGWGLRRFAR